MEKDNEINVNSGSYDFGARIYDSKLGRWLSLDPLMNKYPFASAYMFSVNSVIRFSDIDGRILWDPINKEEVKITYENGVAIYKTVSGKDVSQDFIDNAVPTLNTLTQSETGRSVLKIYETISTRVVFDLDDKENTDNGGNSSWRPTNNAKLNDDGLFEEIIITPFAAKIEKKAKTDKISYEEKLIQVFTVETKHIESKERVAFYLTIKDNNKVYEDPKLFAKVYNDLINNAITKGIEYRKEKGIAIDASSFIPYTSLKATAIGAQIELNEDNKKIYDDVVKDGGKN